MEGRLVSSGCHNGMSQTGPERGRLNNGNFFFSHFWRLGVQDQDVGRLSLL